MHGDGFTDAHDARTGQSIHHSAPQQARHRDRQREQHETKDHRRMECEFGRLDLGPILGQRAPEEHAHDHEDEGGERESKHLAHARCQT